MIASVAVKVLSMYMPACGGMAGDLGIRPDAINIYDPCNVLGLPSSSAPSKSFSPPLSVPLL